MCYICMLCLIIHIYNICIYVYTIAVYLHYKVSVVTAQCKTTLCIHVYVYNF